MVCHSPLYNILLVDDDPNEFAIVKKIVSVLTGAPICIDHVTKASEALRLLSHYNYDLVLLDNRLSNKISAQLTAPWITSTTKQADVAIISYNIDLPYLHDPNTLGVDYVIDKTKMVSFLKDRIFERIGTRVDIRSSA